MDLGSWHKRDRVLFIITGCVLAVGLAALACLLAYVMFVWHR